MEYSVDQGANWAFRGQPVTPLIDMHTTNEIISYSGKARGDISGVYVDGTDTASVNFDLAEITVRTELDF